MARHMKAHRVPEYFDDIIGVASKESDESLSSSPLLFSPPSESLPSELDMFAGSLSVGLPELSREWFEDDEIAEEERLSKSKILQFEL